MALKDLNVSLGLITDNFNRELNKTQRSLRKFQRNVEGIGRDLTQSITVPIAGIATAALSSFADIEKSTKALQNAFESRLGKGAEAIRATEQELELLRKAAMNPGLGFEQAIQGSVRLQAVGFTAEQSRESLLAFGNAIALAGGSAADLDGVSLALTQIASKGKVSAEEINQIAERVPQIRKVMQDLFKTTEGKEIEKLGVSASQFVTLVTAELGTLEKASGGLANSFNNFGSAVKIAMAELGREINTVFDVGEAMDMVVEKIQNTVKWFKSLDDSTKRNIVKFAAMAAAIGPVMLVIGRVTALANVFVGTIGTLNTALATFAAATQGPSAAMTILGGKFNGLKTGFKAFVSSITSINPLFIAVAGAIALTVSAYNDYKRGVDQANSAQNALIDVNRRASESIADEKAQLSQVKDALESSNGTLEDRRTAIESLQKLHPKYFSDLSVEESSIKDITAAMDDYTQALLTRAKLVAAQEKLIEVEKKLLTVHQDTADAGNSLAQGALNLAKTFGHLGGGVQFAIEQGKTMGKNIDSQTKSLEAQRDVLLQTIKLHRGNVDTALNVETPDPVNTKNFVSGGGVKIKTSFEPLATLDLKPIDVPELKIPSFEGFIHSAKAIEDYSKALRAAEQQALVFGTSAGDLLSEKLSITRNALSDAIEKFGATSGVVAKLKAEFLALSEGSALAAYTDQIAQAEQQTRIFGGTAGDLLKSKLDLTKQAILQMLPIFGEASSIVEGLKMKYQELSFSLDNMKTKITEVSIEVGDIVNQAFSDIASGIGESVGEILAGTNKAGSGFKRAIVPLLGALEQVGKLAIATGIAAVGIKKAFELNPIAAIVGGIALIALTKLVKAKMSNIGTGLAQGGIIPPGFPNDTFPARLSSGEAVIPLDRLSKLMPATQGQSQVFIPDLQLRGEDLVIAFRRAEKNHNRFA